MEHNLCRENLSAYLDGELPAGERLSLERHLAACPACSRQLAELRLVSSIFKKHATEPAPRALKDAVFAGREKPAAGYWLKPALAFAAAAAGLLVILALPKFADRDQAIYNPAPSSAPRTGETAQRVPAPESEAAFSGDSAGLGGAGSSGASALQAAAPAGAGGGTARYARPAFQKKGAFTQAKFASRGYAKADAAEGKKPGPASPAAAALSGSAAGGTGFFGAGKAVAAAPSAKAKAAPLVAAKKETLPGWLDRLIGQYQKEPRGNPPYEVWKFIYLGKTVYYLPPQCCDQYSELYGESGALLCAPDGGKSGDGDGKCPDFYAQRKNGELVWKDSRTGK
ncbi:MAG TPA: zf-HC2 domain-containing protein [Elusimicrobiales bacterium]|nr:zf-HC2 domain-containing protein [Elusimicrobiales bacterium]